MEIAMKGNCIPQFFVLFIILWVGNLTASEVERDSSRNALRPGAWALQFAIQQNFTLGSFAGSTLSLKKHFKQDQAFRLGISLNANDREASFEETVVFGNPREHDEKHDDQHINFQITVMYLRYYRSHNRVTIFLGAGPLAAYGRSKGNNVLDVSTDPMETSIRREETKSVNWSLGIVLAFGVEYFINKTLSLTAEYGSSLLYNDVQSDRIRYEDDIGGERYRMDTSIAYKEYHFAAQPVKFGISVYF
jgi:opacity protein-like surface antigen